MKKNTAAQKLLSQRGASLAYALLLFIVCSAVGAVVLTAGTASSGRLRSLAETDSRYYNVTSAAGLLRELFEKTPVTVTQTAEYELDPDDLTSSLIRTSNYVYAFQSDSKICAETASNYLYGARTADVSDSEGFSSPLDTDTRTKNIIMNIALEAKNSEGSDIRLGTNRDGSDAFLSVDVRETIYFPDPGNPADMQLEVTNNSGEPFTLKLLFDAEITPQLPEEANNDDDKIIITEPTEIKWSLKRVEKKVER